MYLRVSFASGTEICYCDMEPSSEILKHFKSRGDNQIMSLEILSIALGSPIFALVLHVSQYAQPELFFLCSGISVFALKIGKSKLVIWSDNTAAEAATRKGLCIFSRSQSHCYLCVEQGRLSNSTKTASSTGYGSGWRSSVPLHGLRECPLPTILQISRLGALF